MGVSQRAYALYHRYKAELPEGARPLTVQIMLDNGILERELVNFFKPFVPSEKKMLNMEKLVSTIYSALKKELRIVIYGDYDPDGMTSSIILYEAIRTVGGKAKMFIPHREKDGYGMNVETIKRIDADLILAVDNGTTAFAAIDQAVSQGMQVLILDHHQLATDGRMPNAILVNPWQPGDEYPEKNLSSAGIAYHFARELYCQAGEEADFANELLPLVAIGLVADQMPMLSEVRHLVQTGLEEMKAFGHPAFQSLLKKMRIRTVTFGTIGFSIAPALNATGRLGDAMDIADWWFESDPKRREQRTVKIVATNEDRKRLSAVSTKSAFRRVETELIDDPFLVVVDRASPAGIVGITAAHLASQYRRPALVLAEHYDETVGRMTLTGSARSVEPISLIEALDFAKDLLLRYGGHHMAAGAAMEDDPDLIRALRVRLAQFMATQKPPLIADPTPLEILDVTNGKQLYAVLYATKPLFPFDKNGFPPPIFGLVNIGPVMPRIIKEQHLFFKVRSLDVNLFGLYHDYEQLGGAPFELLVSPDENQEGKPCFRGVKILPAGSLARLAVSV